jgi:PAS domain-containing protein
MVFSGQRGFISRHWGSSGWISYTFGFVSAWVALSLWAISSLMHDTPFSCFSGGCCNGTVCRFRSALLCTAVSAVFLDYFVFLPGFTFSTSSADLQRLAVFLGISVVVGSLARQRSRGAARRANTQQMAAIVRCSDDAIFSTNSEGMITSWNRGAETLYQYPADEVWDDM